MGLICPCGTRPDREEGLPPKISSTGCSTQQQSTGRNGSHHGKDRKTSSSSKKGLPSMEDSAAVVEEVNRGPKSRGISCTPGEIQQTSHLITKKESQDKKTRRSRSSSSNHRTANPDGDKSKKHRRRHHSTDGKETEKSALDKQHHKGYGGTTVTGDGEIKIAERLSRRDVKKKHRNPKPIGQDVIETPERTTPRNDHKTERKMPKHEVSNVPETPDIIKGKRNKQQHLDPKNRVKYIGTVDVNANTSFGAERLTLREDDKQRPPDQKRAAPKERPIQETVDKGHRRKRNKPPAYVIPMSAMLE